MKLSIIMPVLNEAAHLPETLALPDLQANGIEILVVDGGSEDNTRAIARRAGARVLSAPRGRGQQLQAGAQAARGDILLFLHADTRLRPGAIAALLRAMADPQVIGGNYRLLFDGGRAFDRWLIRFYAWLRDRGFYYGDSAIFVRRDLYHAIGGIRAIPIMEDICFVRRLENSGRTVSIQDPPAITSSRRFENRSPVMIVSQWIIMHLLFKLGLSPRLLARYYRATRH